MIKTATRLFWVDPGRARPCVGEGAGYARAYKLCGKQQEAETWARKLVELLECANILTKN